MSADERQRWERETYAEAVRRSPERQPSFETESGLPVAPLYGPPALGAAPGAIRMEPGGYPGEFPYTRGIQPT
ncbi:MAG: methylmalonyl-CoA mutase, partial [Dehalococcoidia bacterium]